MVVRFIQGVKMFKIEVFVEDEVFRKYATLPITHALAQILARNEFKEVKFSKL